MTSPPGTPPTQAHRRPISANAAHAAAAIKRAGHAPTPGNIRWVIRAQRAASARRSDVVALMTDVDWDALVRTAPFARKRTKVRACDPRRDGRRQA